MKLSTRATYGIRLCFMLAVAKSPLSAAQLEKQTDVTRKYLEQLLAMLKSGGIVVSFRGKSGGYELARDPAQITVMDMLNALEDGFVAPDCVDGKCDDMYCPNRRMFYEINNGISNVLSSVTLQKMVDDYRNDCGREQ
ncbi:MAG: Rrf2 family transcriptional regulator [Clostridiales bacterium]|nr:Rrf2 family transcriptional regulator [Clostridiales bacterium]